MNDDNILNSDNKNKSKRSFNKGNQNKKTQFNNAIKFLEELSWLLDQRNINILRNLPEMLKEKTDLEMNLVAGDFVSPNPNKHFLIGVLPRLFQDKNLFPTNEDIAEFASSALNVKVSRSEKRSKYELIGLVVCETNELNDCKLSELVSALSSITRSAEKLNSIIEARKLGSFSWNEAIKKLASTDYND